VNWETSSWGTPASRSAFCTVLRQGPVGAQTPRGPYERTSCSTRFLRLARLRSRALVHSTAVEMSTRAEPGNMAPLVSDLAELLAPVLALGRPEAPSSTTRRLLAGDQPKQYQRT
jgi:hypothetical protein